MQPKIIIWDRFGSLRPPFSLGNCKVLSWILGCFFCHINFEIILSKLSNLADLQPFDSSLWQWIECLHPGYKIRAKSFNVCNKYSNDTWSNAFWASRDLIIDSDFLSCWYLPAINPVWSGWIIWVIIWLTHLAKTAVSIVIPWIGRISTWVKSKDPFSWKLAPLYVHWPDSLDKCFDAGDLAWLPVHWLWHHTVKISSHQQQSSAIP